MHFLTVSHSLGESECFNESIQLRKAVMEDAQGFICILVMVWIKQLVCCQGTHSYTSGRLFLLSSSHQKLTVTWQNYSCSSDFYQTSPCMLTIIYMICCPVYISGGGGDCPNLFWAVFVTFKVFCVHQNHYYNHYLLFEGIFCNGCIWDPSFLYGF